MKDIPKFDYAISNPPYQDEKNTPIFQYVQKMANNIAESSTMIYMASRWWYGTQGLVKFHEDIFHNKRLKKVVFYNERESSLKIFDGTLISGGLSIVDFSEKDNQAFELVENLTNETVNIEHGSVFLPIQASLVNIAKKIQNRRRELDLPTVFERGESIYWPLRIQGRQFDQYNPIRIEEDFTNMDENKIKIYANITGDRHGKTYYYLMDKPENLVVNNKYKVCAGQSIIENSHRPLRLFLFDKGTYFGRSSVSMAYFDDKKSAENFLKYASTTFYEFCVRLSLSGRMRSWCYYNPDFIDYTSSNIWVNWDKSVENIDEQLFNLFELTDEDIEVMKKKNLLK